MPTSGLHESVRVQAEALIRQLLPLWLSEIPRDLKRVILPTGPGNFQLNVEQYRGVRTWISFRDQAARAEQLATFERTVREEQPKLLGYLVLPGRAMSLNDPVALVIHWVTVVSESMAQNGNMDESIKALLDQLHTALTTGLLKQTVLSPLTGLALPEAITTIELEDDARIRQMTNQEVSDLGSGDVLGMSRHDIVMNPVQVAYERNENIPFSLLDAPGESTLASDFQARAANSLSNVFRALHVLKSGKVGIVGNFFSIGPPVLPHLQGYSTYTSAPPSFCSMTLSRDEVDLLKTTLIKLQTTQRDEVQIAASRLTDAESRTSPVDSLMDAAIGLEAILNPNDFSELAFRVAVNYAFMGRPEDRRERFDRIRTIQKTRNAVVHGGLNLQSRQAQLIHEHATLAKSTLRDAINGFLFDKTLGGNRKLDADFWIDRMLPQVVGAPLLKTSD